MKRTPAQDHHPVGLAALGRGIVAALPDAASTLRGTVNLLRNQLRPGTTLADRIALHARRHPDRCALRFEDQSWSYEELDQWVTRLATGLQQQGVRSGHCIGILADNRPESLVAVAALIRCGAIAGMLNPGLRDDALAHAAKTMDLRGILASNGLIPLAEQAGLSQLPIRINLDRETRSDWIGMEQVLARPGIPPIPPSNPPSAAYYILTSGTTGLPKASVMTHRRWIQAMAGMGQLALRLRADDTLYCPLPLYHNNALTVSWGAVLGAGATFALETRFSASRFWQRARHFRATAFCYIGELCRYLLAQAPTEADRNHEIRAVIGNGLRPELWNEFKQRFGIDQICEFYGASEGNLVFVNGFNLDHTAGFCPYPYAVVACDPERAEALRDADGRLRKVARGETGLLLTKITRSVPFDGYTDSAASDSKLIHNAFSDGDCWFNTGDLVRDQGLRHIQFVDRLGDTFRWKGENVATTEVEAVLSSIDGIRECTVYGAQAPGYDGRAGMAALVLDDPGLLEKAEFLTELQSRLPEYAIPLFLRQVDSLETTATFKRRKQDLREAGADPQADSDPRWVRLAGSEYYQRLDADQWQAITRGDQRL